MRVEDLKLGLRVEVNESSEYHHEYIGEEFFINGLSIDSDGVTVDITIGEYLGEHQSDGWNVEELTLIN